MSTQPLADVITAIREMVGDTGGNREQTVRTETPTGKMDGANKIFTIQYYPVDVDTFKLYNTNGVLLTGGGVDYTLTAATGLIVMVVAPTFADKLTASYTFVWFEDGRYYEFVWNAGQRVGTTGTNHASGTTPEERATSTVLGLNDGLMDAVRLFASCEYCNRRATEAAHKVASSGGGQSFSPPTDLSLA